MVLNIAGIVLKLVHLRQNITSFVEKMNPYASEKKLAVLTILSIDVLINGFFLDFVFHVFAKTPMSIRHALAFGLSIMLLEKALERTWNATVKGLSSVARSFKLR